MELLLMKISNEIIVNVFTEGLDKNTYAYPCLKAFAEGVSNVGDNAALITKKKYAPCDVAVIFGDVREAKSKTKRMKFKAEVKGRHIRRGLIVIDTAILTRSSSVGHLYRRIGIDGLLRDEGEFCNQQKPDDRWKILMQHANLNIHPWRDNGEKIVIALQRPIDASLKGSEKLRPDNYATWLLSVITDLQKNFQSPIYVRPHPGSTGNNIEEKWLLSVKDKLPDNVIWDTRPLTFEQSLEDCKFCVTYNSGAGVDSALLGVPVIASDEGSFAWEVASHYPENNIEKISMPDRQQWLNNLAYVEWSIDEIEQGMPWRHLRDKILEYI